MTTYRHEFKEGTTLNQDEHARLMAKLEVAQEIRTILEGGK